MNQYKKLACLSYDPNKFEDDRYFALWWHSICLDYYDNIKCYAASQQKIVKQNPHLDDLFVEIKKFKKDLDGFKSKIKDKSFNVNDEIAKLQICSGVDEFNERVYGLSELM